METTSIPTPETAPIPAPVEIQPPVEVPATVETSSSPSFEDGGAFENKSPLKFKMVDILIMALWIVVPIYGIVYYRKAIKKIDEQPSTEEFDDMKGDIDEVKYNLKKAMGQKYETI